MCEYDGPKQGLAWLSHQGSCDTCRAESWENYEVPRIVFGAVPGGTTKASISKVNHQRFNRDMDSYREARRHGLKPSKVSEKAVQEAEMIAYGVKSEHDILKG